MIRFMLILCVCLGQNIAIVFLVYFAQEFSRYLLVNEEIHGKCGFYLKLQPINHLLKCDRHSIVPFLFETNECFALFYKGAVAASPIIKSIENFFH